MYSFITLAVLKHIFVWSATCTLRHCVVYFDIIGTHGSGSYVGLASWAWFSIERFNTVTKRCLYSPVKVKFGRILQL